MQLNQKQQLTMQKVIEGKNIFIDGPGGVGKQVLVREIMNRFGDQTVLLAPTGIAALNINGQTIHSTFGFPLNVLSEKDFLHTKEKTEQLFAKDGPVRTLVIDEISMTRVDILHGIDQHLRRIRRLKHSPFGGLQVIVVGDFYQLSPVLTRNEESIFYEMYSSPFCFSDETWSSAQFEHIHLDQIMRQSDERFISNLMKIRNKSDGWKDSIKFFNNICVPNKENVLDNDPVFLCSINRVADTINQNNYDELDEKEYKFIAHKQGRFSTYPSPYELNLKHGTKVILTANTNDFLNGQTGYFIDKVGNRLEILLEEDERTVMVEKFKWEEKEPCRSPNGVTYDVVGTYTQYPVCHGWARSIHKGQGMTIKNGIIHLGNGAFCHGQTYVALSRMKTLEGMAFFSPIKESDIIVSREINEFYENDCRGVGLF